MSGCNVTNWIKKKIKKNKANELDGKLTSDNDTFYVIGKRVYFGKP